MPSIATWVDLTEPVMGTGRGSHPAARTMPGSGRSVLANRSRSAPTAAAAVFPRAETNPLGPAHPNSAPTVLALGSDGSVVAAMIAPQLSSVATLPMIDAHAQDEQAPTAPSSLGVTPNSPPVADAAAEMRTDPDSESVAEPQISATSTASSKLGPVGEDVPPDRESGRAETAESASGAPAKITVDGSHANVAQNGVETVTGRIASGSTQYALPVPSSGIALSSPADGLIITPDEPPVVVVEGSVDDRRTTTLWVVANDRRIPVQVSDGRFRKIVPLVEPTLRVWAEASLAGEPGSRSQIVTVHTTGARKPSAILVMEWPRESLDLDVQVSAIWRAHPDNLNEVAQPIRLTPVSQPSSTGPSDVFWLRNARPGAYSMVLRYRGLPPNGDVHPTLYVPDGDGLAMRAIRPVRLGSSGKVVLARVLLPQGVLWEQDGWFSGSSESVDTVTKFRFPDGIRWEERKADLQ
jgi:hypothetical protein